MRNTLQSDVVDDQGALSQDEAKTLIRNCLKHAGAEGVAEDELTRLVDWAEDVRINSATLDLVLEGKVAVGFREGEQQPVFYLPSRTAA